MKNLSTFSHFNKVEMSRDDLEKLLYEVVNAFQENESKYGMEPIDAMDDAILETLSGMDAIRELQLIGENVAPGYKFSL